MRGYDVLDVGCGANPSGHVNTDINSGLNMEIRQLAEGVMMQPRAIPNFVKCSGEYLPFREGSFNHVKSYHVIEHVKHPGLFLRECKRVSRHRVTIVCPHRYAPRSWGKTAIYHRHVFSSKSWVGTGWFKKEISEFTYIPSQFLPLFRIPKEFTVTFYKRRH